MNTQNRNEVEQQISKGNKRKYFLESLSSKIFLACALLSVVSLLLIVGFVFYKGANPFVTGGYSFFDFLFGSDWVPSEDKFGIFPDDRCVNLCNDRSTCYRGTNRIINSNFPGGNCSEISSQNRITGNSAFGTVFRQYYTVYSV